MIDTSGNAVTLIVTDPSLAFRPGDTIHATVIWPPERPPQTIEARLLWYTAGRGTVDTGVVVTAAWTPTPVTAEWTFEIVVPDDGPPSYAGKLISVCWALEVLADRETAWDRVDLVVSPTGRELRPPDGDPNEAPPV